MKQTQIGPILARLNRFLLEDAYPLELSSGRKNDFDDSLRYEEFFGNHEHVQIGEEVPMGFIRDTLTRNNTTERCKKVWQQRNNCRWTHDVKDYSNLGGHYFDVAHSKTKCEIAVRFGPEKRPLGVLNVESFKDSFDSRDIENLQILGQLATSAV